MRRPRPSLPPLTIPHHDIVEQWLDRFDGADSIDEHPEYSLNLGAESPASGLSCDEDRIPTPPPQRVFPRRTAKSVAKNQRKRDAVDRDCGICFEYAVQPSRTLCCGKIFCLEHITDWLHGPSSDGRCPSCSAPCSTANILSLASPTLRFKPSTSQDASSGTITTSPVAITTSPRNRSQSTSTVSTSGSKPTRSSTTTTTTSSSSFDSSLASSILCLSPSPEELEPEQESEHPIRDDFQLSSTTQQLLTTALAFTQTYYPRSLSRSQSSSSLSALAHSQQDPHQQSGGNGARVHPIIDTGSSTVEVISRLTSVLGLTLLFYALLASS